MAWRLAKSLEKMRSQFNQQYPNRNKASDGTVGDASHQSRNSDHNPWIKDGSYGVVSAIDITHDPKNGVDVHAICRYMSQPGKRDSRIKYMISAKQICSSTTQPWVWRAYTGSNPHQQHAHWSVKETKSHYDDERPWDLGFAGTAPAPQPPGPAEPMPPPEQRPVLRKGSRGDYVRTVQRLLYAPIDGSFGPTTEAAVKGFQRGVALSADGVVGQLTWSELDALEQIPTDQNWQTDITATVFGGKGDPNKSAYEDRNITDEEIGVALPYRFKGNRPQVDVVNAANGRRVTAEIVDVGPWNTDDPYWEKGTRPQAESGKDTKGRVTNGAGIDLTPQAAREIGLAGKGVVNWAFASVEDEES
jgi:peptidoglycan hydrolase-like protein with peptidoglycan-binding domain